MSLSKRHIEFFSQCLGEECEKAGIDPISGTFLFQIDREIFLRAFGKGKHLLVPGFHIIFVVCFAVLAFPLIKLLPIDSGWFFLGYFGLLLGINFFSIWLSPKIIGRIFDKPIKSGCRSFAKNVAEDADAFLMTEPDENS